jgi:ATP/maltotriose-dependent transcriptional regulator MalT
MENVDDDDCITQLASAWVGLQSGEQDKIVQASFTFEELADKYEKSFVLYNGLAACELAKGQWKKAFSHLKNARNSALQQGQAVPAETLVNTIIVLHHMGKSAAVAKVKAELVELYPNHPWLAQQDKIAATFDSAAHTQSS